MAYTPNLHMYLPIPKEKGWGEHVNNNMSIIDTEIGNLKEKTAGNIATEDYVDDAISDAIDGLVIGDITIDSDVNLNAKSITNINTLSPTIPQWLATATQAPMFSRGTFTTTTSFTVPANVHPNSSLALFLTLSVSTSHTGTTTTMTATVKKNDTVVFTASGDGGYNSGTRVTKALGYVNCQAGDVFTLTISHSNTQYGTGSASAGVYAIKQVPVLQN